MLFGLFAQFSSPKQCKNVWFIMVTWKCYVIISEICSVKNVLVFLRIPRTASPCLWLQPQPQIADPYLILCWQEFLQDKHLFHGDVAARNILIQSDLTAKLCGLGLAYEVHARGAIPATHMVPLKWLAPERLLLRPAGIRGDVYGLFLPFRLRPFLT